MCIVVAWRHQGAAAIRLHIIQRLRFQLLDGLALQFGSKKWTFYSAQVANNQPVEASQAVSPFKSRPCSFPLPFWRMTACPSANISTNDRTAWYYVDCCTLFSLVERYLRGQFFCPAVMRQCAGTTE